MIWNTYTILSLVFLLITAGFAFSVIGILIRKAWTDKTEFRKEVKSWKYGKFLWVYLIAFPLFILSFVSEGQSAGYCIFKALTNAFKLMALQFDFDLSLVNSNLMYKIAIYTCYTVATLNVILFVVSCVNQAFWTFMNTFFLKHRLTRKDIILGNNENSEEIYRTAPKKADKVRHRKAIFDVMSKEQKWNLFAKGVHYVSETSSLRLKNKIKSILEVFFKKAGRVEKRIGKLEKKIQKLEDKIFNLGISNKTKNKVNRYKKSISRLSQAIAKIKNKRRVCIFINFESDQKNIEYCAFLSETINELLANNNIKDKMLQYIDVYAYSSLKYTNVYKGYITNLKGCLHLIDKEKIIAYTFANEHPIALYMTEKQVDFKTSLLKKGVNVSVNFIGFGKTQQQIFLTMFSNTQFVKKRGNRIVQAPVNFKFYDIKDTTVDSNEWNNSIKKYFDWAKRNKGSHQYYPLPQLNQIDTPSVSSIGDINSSKITGNFIKTLQNPTGKNINYVIISLGEDFTSIDVGNRIYNTIKNDPEMYKNCFIFIRIDKSQDCFNTIKLFNKEKDQVCLVGKYTDKRFRKFKKEIDPDNKNILNKEFVIGKHQDKVTVKFTKNKNKLLVCIEGNEIKAQEINKKYFGGTLDIHCKRFIYASYFKENENTASQVFYDYKRIVPDVLTKIAIMQDKLYDAMSTYGYSAQKCLILSYDKDVVEENRIKWSLENDEYTRNSSFHSALNLRSKLLLMGLDYTDGKYTKDDYFTTYEKYWEYIGGDNVPVLDGNILHVAKAYKKPDLKEEAFNNVIVKKDNKKLKIKDKDFNKSYGVDKKTKEYINGLECLYFVYDPINVLSKEIEHRRWALVNMEHNRWNAFMIATQCCLPLKKSEVSDNGNTKDREANQNACLTTMSGLITLQEDWLKYRKKHNKQKLSEKELRYLTNKINYDYLQFDPAWHLLKRVGCKIVYSKNCPDSIKPKQSKTKNKK